ncbi:MAG: cysteine hydrolase [Burkholderiales bacterium]|nr:cysteine hydrolase [Burkholderiales bacterium]
MSAAAIYLVLDMENELVHPNGAAAKGPFGSQVKERDIVARTRTALAKARDAGLKIGYVRVGFSPDYRECPPASPIFSAARANGMFKLGTWASEIHADIAPRSGDFDIVKHRVSPWYGTSLEPILRANGIGRIYCSGISTNAVVQACVREGHDRDYEMIIIEDCCCAMSAEEHAASIAGLKRFAVEITTSAEVTFR